MSKSLPYPRDPSEPHMELPHCNCAAVSRTRANIVEVEVAALAGRNIHVGGIFIGVRRRDGVIRLAILTDADHPVRIVRSNTPINLLTDNSALYGQKPLVRTGPGGDFTRDYTPGEKNA